MPNLSLTSYGAAGEVTGSCHLLQYGAQQIMIDCGLFQGSHENYQKNFLDFPFDPKKINALILTHAHLDHCGRLPLLYKKGFRGPIYSTGATRDLTQIVLDDNLIIMQEKSIKYKQPLLYGSLETKKVMELFQPLKYYQKKELGKKVNFSLHNAGHILGSSFVEIKIEDQTIVFSGDLGAQDMPLVKNADVINKADYLILESTYGDSQHENKNLRDEKLLEAVRKTIEKNSTLLISLFAIERTQDVLKVLNDYYEKHLDFPVPVYLDSPMAIKATEVYKKHLELLNPAAQADLAGDHDIFNFPHLKISNTIEKSQAINAAPTPKIILAGSGMAEGGRILHHLAHYAPQAKNNILFMGFQVPGTLGYKLINGAFEFDYFGNKIPIGARVDQIQSFSAHADKNDLQEWLSHLISVKKIFLSHGDPETMPLLAKLIKDHFRWPVEMLEPAKTYQLK